MNGCLVEMASAKGAARPARWVARCCCQRFGFTRPAGTVLLCWWPFISVRIWEWREEVVGKLQYHTQLTRRVPGVKEPESGGIM